MPQAFDNMLDSIRKSLRGKTNPRNNKPYSDDDIYAIAVAQWKKDHGGKAPNQKLTDLIFNFNVPITEFYKPQEINLEEGLVEDNFFIEGIAISASITSNNHKFLTEELRSAAGSLNGVPLLVDHRNEVSAIKGRVLNGTFNESLQHIKFKANVKDKEIRQMISDGRINSVSVGAVVKELEEGDDGTMIPRGISFKELSLVAVPADDNATFSVALKEAYEKRSQEDLINNLIDEYKSESLLSLKLEGGKKEMLSDTPEIKEKEISEKVPEVVQEKSEISLKEQVESLQKKMTELEEKQKGKKHPPIDVEEEEINEVEEKYKIVQGHGDLRGGSFTIVRNKY